MSKNHKTKKTNPPAESKAMIPPSTQARFNKTDTHSDAKEPIVETKKGFWRNNIFSILIIAALSMGIYAQSIGFDYALDDTMVIVKNEFTKKGIGGIGDIFRYESFRGYFGEKKVLLEGDRYRPLSIATFAIEQSLLGGNKAVSHFINLLLYTLTGILLFRVLCLMFPPKMSEKTENMERSDIPKAFGTEGPLSTYFNLPFIATLLFITHPLHVEVVANIKGRDEIIALLGELSALYFTFKYLYKNKIKYLIYSFSAFCIGIFSKESVITFLAIIPLTAHFFTKATFSDKVKVTMPALFGTLFYLAMRVNAIGYLLDSKEIVDLMNNPFYGMSVDDKMATIFYTFLVYFKLHIFPHPLTHDYYPYHIPRMTWGDWQAWFSLLLHVGLGVVIWRGWRSRSVWAYSAAFYLVTLSIVSNLFVSVGTFMNERFVYHASLGFCLALAYFLTKMSQNTVEERNPDAFGKGPLSDAFTKIAKPVAIGIAALFIIGFSLKTIIRVPDWRNGTTLNDSAIKNSPNSARANCFFAISMWENRFTKFPKDAPDAEKWACLDSIKMYFNKSVEILPKYGAAQKMRAAVAAEYHKRDKQLEPLLTVFDEVNKSGTYEKFVLDYLKFINNQPYSAADAKKLMNFYEEMKKFYKNNYPNSNLNSEYEALITQLKILIPQ
jgi:protein O-mannosyl-transferase